MRRLLLLSLAGCVESGQVVIDDPADDVPDTDGAGVDTDDTLVDPPDTDREQPETDDTEPGGDPLVPPSPTAPCGTDNDVFNGEIRPDLGTLPRPSAFTGDPGENGPWGRISRKGSVRNPTRGRDAIEVTSHVPSSDGTTPAEGKFPLVILMPGFGVDVTSYAHFYLPMATHGFVVVSLTFPNTGFLDPAAHDKNALEAKAVIDWAIGDGPFADLIDPTKIAAVGHSQGGKIAFYAASIDPRIDVVVAWDPQNSGGPPCFVPDIGSGNCNDFPVAPNCEARNSGLVHQMKAESLTFAAEDGLVTPDAHLRAVNFYRGAPSPAHLVYMPESGHAAWASKTSAESRVSRYVSNALLLARLQNKTGLEDWLPGGSKLDGESTVDSHRSK